MTDFNDKLDALFESRDNPILHESREGLGCRMT